MRSFHKLKSSIEDYTDAVNTLTRYFKSGLEEKLRQVEPDDSDLLLDVKVSKYGSLIFELCYPVCDEQTYEEFEDSFESSVDNLVDQLEELFGADEDYNVVSRDTVRFENNFGLYCEIEVNPVRLYV